MFSYLNKVVGIEIRNQNASGGLYDILLNNAYVGSSTGSGIGDGAYLIGSNNNLLAFQTNTGVPLPTYYFSDLLLNTGINELSFVGDTAASGSRISKINLYQIVGSTLINSNAPEIEADPLLWSQYSVGTVAKWNITNFGRELDFRIIGQGEEAAYASGRTTLPAGGSISFDYVITSEVEILNSGYDETNFKILVDGSEERSNVLESITDGGDPELFETVSVSDSFSYINSGSSPVDIDILINFDTQDATANPIGIGTNLKINNFKKNPSNFYLEYPFGRSIPLTETPPIFNVDTGNLNQVFTGSGVHLKKDVTLFFDILDQQLNTVSSNQQFLENPLISGCVFDILNVDGTTAAANFSTGKSSRSLAFSALDNENVFGSYQKDFGVRCKLPNTFDGSVFTGEFYAYGNVPNILDIAPDYTEFSGEAKATELINVAVVLQNDLNFTQIDRYDVYALTGSGSAVNELTYLAPFAQEGYLFSQSAADVVNARSLTINRGTLPQDVPHYFTVVPYGALGSGSPFMFGPAVFVTVENIIVLPETNSSALNLYDGNSFGQTIYKTGKFFSDTGILHEFSSGQFSSVKYFIEIFGSGQRRLSDLKGVINTTGLVLTKKPVNDTATQYQLTGFASGLCGLFASGSGYANYLYELQATTI